MSKKTEDEPPIERRIKVLSIGSGGCGKSCLIKRYCEGKFVSRYICTIGVDFGVKPVTLDGKVVKVNFWDLSGQDEFAEVRAEFYRDTQGCILVFDVSNRTSFEDLDKWLTEATRLFSVPPVMYLVGNKVDKKRVVTAGEGRAWAVAHDMEYFETSCNSGEGVTEMFDTLFRKVFDRYWGAKKTAAATK